MNPKYMPSQSNVLGSDPMSGDTGNAVFNRVVGSGMLPSHIASQYSPQDYAKFNSLVQTLGQVHQGKPFGSFMAKLGTILSPGQTPGQIGNGGQ